MRFINFAFIRYVILILLQYTFFVLADLLLARVERVLILCSKINLRSIVVLGKVQYDDDES